MGTRDDKATLFDNQADSKKVASKSPRARTRRKGHAAKVYVASSNWSIGSFLARGAMMCPALGEETGCTFFDNEHPGTLLVSKGGIPSAWCEGIRKGAKNAYPIAVEMKREAAQSLSTDDPCLGVSLLEVERLVFESQRDADLLLGQGFSEWDLEELGLPWGVEPGIFGEGKALSSKAADEIASLVGEKDEGGLAAADGLAAAIAIMPSALPGRATWMSLYEQAWLGKLTDEGREARWMRAMLSGARPEYDAEESTIEEALLAATSHLLVTQYGTSVGWPATEVLEAVVLKTKSCCEPEELKKGSTILDGWAKRCLEILGARSDPPNLLDQGQIPMRAVLLLLLRGNVEAILSGSEGTGVLRIGQEVKALAAVLASFRAGLRHVPYRLKVGGSEGRGIDLVGALGERFLAELKSEKALPQKGKSSEVSVKYRRIGVLSGEWVVKRGSAELLRKTRDVNPELRRAYTMGLSLGYDLEEYGEEGLTTRFEWGDGRAQPVYIELLKASEAKDTTLRFWSPALSVAPRRNPKTPTWPTSKLKALKIDGLVELLEKNAQPGMRCRYGIDRSRQAVVVIVDQLLSTLDEEEFRQHLEHVAAVADEYERQLGVDEFR